MPRSTRILPDPPIARRPPVVGAHAGGYRTPRNEYDEFVLEGLRREVDSVKNLPAEPSVIAPRVRLLDFLLEHGRFYAPQGLPKGYRAGIRQKCYTNAQGRGTNCPDLTYVEGRALAVVAHPHGWCVTTSGEVIDPTWTGRRGRPQGMSYFGVPIDAAHVRQVIIASESFGPILTDEAFEDADDNQISVHPPDRIRHRQP